MKNSKGKFKDLKDKENCVKSQKRNEKIYLQKKKRYRASESSRVNAERLKQELNVQAAQHEELAGNVEGDLKLEREWRVSLQESMQQDRERISKLQVENSHLQVIAQKYASLQENYYSLKEQALEQEQTLEELGSQLSTSKLQLSDMKEEIHRSKVDGAWVKDKTATHCKGCKKEFILTRRKHHCRNCGDIFCHSCSDNSMLLPSSAKPVRVCDECQIVLVGRYSVM